MVDVIVYGLLIGTSSAWLLVFGLLWKRKQVKVAEPNRAIRAFETLMLATILGFAVWATVGLVRKMWKSKG